MPRARNVTRVIKTTKYAKAAPKKRGPKRYKTNKMYLAKFAASLFPPVKYYKTKMCFSYTLPTTTLNTINFDYLNIGSIYDILGTSGTRQPVNTSLMFSAYKYLQILGIAGKFTAMTPYGDANPVIMMLAIQNEATALAQIDEIDDFYECDLKCAPVKMWGNYMTKNLNTNNYIKFKYSAKKYYRQKIVGESDYSATESANPSVFPRLGVYWTTPPGATLNGSTITFMVQLSLFVCGWGKQMRDNDN